MISVICGTFLSEIRIYLSLIFTVFKVDYSTTLLGIHHKIGLMMRQAQ
jgi:hypothetical protein